MGGSLLLSREAAANVVEGRWGERVWRIRENWDSGADKKRLLDHLDSKINLAVCSNNFN